MHNAVHDNKHLKIRSEQSILVQFHPFVCMSSCMPACLVCVCVCGCACLQECMCVQEVMELTPSLESDIYIPIVPLFCVHKKHTYITNNKEEIGSWFFLPITKQQKQETCKNCTEQHNVPFSVKTAHSAEKPRTHWQGRANSSSK